MIQALVTLVGYAVHFVTEVGLSVEHDPVAERCRVKCILGKCNPKEKLHLQFVSLSSRKGILVLLMIDSGSRSALYKTDLPRPQYDEDLEGIEEESVKDGDIAGGSYP